jgi:hypothetical protein
MRRPIRYIIAKFFILQSIPDEVLTGFELQDYRWVSFMVIAGLGFVGVTGERHDQLFTGFGFRFATSFTIRYIVRSWPRHLLQRHVALLLHCDRSSVGPDPER